MLQLQYGSRNFSAIVDDKDKFILKNEEGVPYLMTGISGDITDRKLAEIELLNYKTIQYANFNRTKRPRFYFI
mgnify:CR=1 FL=1